MDHIEKEKRPKSFMIWKCHHSFGDGTSTSALILALSKEFDRSYFLAGKDVPRAMRLLTRVLVPFYIPKLIVNTLFSGFDKNYFTERRLKNN